MMQEQEEEKDDEKKEKPEEKEDHYASTDSSASGVIETDIFPRCRVIEDDNLSILKMKSGKRKEKEITMHRLILVLARCSNMILFPGAG